MKHKRPVRNEVYPYDRASDVKNSFDTDLQTEAHFYSSLHKADISSKVLELAQKVRQASG